MQGPNSTRRSCLNFFFCQGKTEHGEAGLYQEGGAGKGGGRQIGSSRRSLLPLFPLCSTVFVSIFFLLFILFYYYLLICGSLFPTFPQFSSILHYEANPKPQTLNPISHYFLLFSSVSQRSSTMKEIYQGTDF